MCSKGECREGTKTCCDNFYHEFGIEGDSNDLFYVNEDENFKAIRLMSDVGNSSVTLEVTSVDETGEHELINRLLGKKIRIMVSALEE